MNQRSYDRFWRPILGIFLTVATLCGVAQESLAANSCVDVFAAQDAVNLSIWARKQNSQSNAILKQSSNKAPLEKWLWETMDVGSTPDGTKLKDGRDFEIVRTGLQGTTEIRIVSKEKTEVVFSTDQLNRKGNLSFNQFMLSADQKTVVIGFFEKGSIDSMRVVVVDLPNRKILLDESDVAAYSVRWIDRDRLAFALREGIRIWNRKDGTSVHNENTSMGSSTGNWTLLAAKRKTIAFRSDGQKLILDWPTDRGVPSLLGETKNFLVLQHRDTDGIMRFSRVLKRNTTASMPVLDIPISLKGLPDRYSVAGDRLVVQSHWGAKQFLEMFEMNGSEFTKIELPECCAYVGSKVSPDRKKIEVSLRSLVQKRKTFAYDLKTKTWDDPAIAEKMMTDGENAFVTEIVMVESNDGVEIPMRITRSQSTQADGKAGVYFQVYGGFNNPGYLNPRESKLIAKFLLDGGILAGPALRGGNEYGKPWHRDGILAEKRHTIQDLIASAEWMIAQGWTEPNRIITTGTSNGGFVVASAALQSPKTFGLVIPVAGVHDLNNITTLDMYGRNWTKEYGDAANAADLKFIDQMSPLTLAAGIQPPKMQIIHGLQDSRVNVEHSHRLVEAIKAKNWPDLQMSSIHLKNAGHWQEAPDVQNVIAWRTEVIRWTAIYDHLGWKFETPTSSHLERSSFR